MTRLVYIDLRPFSISRVKRLSFCQVVQFFGRCAAETLPVHSCRHKDVSGSSVCGSDSCYSYTRTWRPERVSNGSCEKAARIGADHVPYFGETNGGGVVTGGKLREVRRDCRRMRRRTVMVRSFNMSASGLEKNRRPGNPFCCRR